MMSIIEIDIIIIQQWLKIISKITFLHIERL